MTFAGRSVALGVAFLMPLGSWKCRKGWFVQSPLIGGQCLSLGAARPEAQGPSGVLSPARLVGTVQAVTTGAFRPQNVPQIPGVVVTGTVLSSSHCWGDQVLTGTS